MSKKAITCGIADYLESHHPDVYKAIKELCLFSSIKPRRGNYVAFVLPDQKVLDKVLKDVMSDKESEVQSALDTMSAHILISDGPMKTVNDLKIGVSNRLGKVFNSAEAKLSVDNGFRMLPSKHENTYVFKAEGPMPLGSVEAPRIAPGGKRPPRRVEGSGELNRNALAAKVQECLDTQKRLSFVQVVLSILKNLEKNDQDQFNKALLTLDPSPIASFYLLVEPFKSGNFLLNLSSLPENINELFAGEGGEGIFKEYVSYLKKGADLLTADIDNIVDSARWKIIEGGISRTTVPNNIKAAYQSVSSLYKSEVNAGELKDPSFKEWQDVARYHINYMYTYLEDPFAGHKHEAAEFVATVTAILGGNKKFSVPSENITSNADFLAGPISFVQSGSFLYYPFDKKRITGGATDDNGLPPPVIETAAAGTGTTEVLGKCAECGKL